MPHKHNPVDSVLVNAAVLRSPGLVGTLFATSVHEHQRAAGAWHAQWLPLLELLGLADGATARTARLVAQLQVHPERMRRNLDASGGLVMAESVATRLAAVIGRTAAHERVRDATLAAASAGGFARALADDDAVRGALGEAGIAEALDPLSWLGSSPDIIDSARARHRLLTQSRDVP